MSAVKDIKAQHLAKADKRWEAASKDGMDFSRVGELVRRLA